MIKKDVKNINNISDNSNDDNVLNFYHNAVSDDYKDNFSTDDVNNNLSQNDNYLEQVALEILKKSNVIGGPEKVADEFVKIYNILKSKIVFNKQNRHIPKQTVFDDYIICLEDGKKMKMLNRHLKVKYGMSFEDYKQKWGLPIDYPNVCKNYSKIRANIARKRKK